MSLRLGCLVSLIAISVPVFAEDFCPVSHAIYGQENTEYTLHFKPRPDGTEGTTTNFFELIFPDWPHRLEGGVIWNMGASRPNGFLRFDCPKDAFSTEDFAPCTYWQGVVYAIGDRTADFLPAYDDPPPDALLLPDLSRRLYYSGLRIRTDGLSLQNFPADAFTLTGCSQ